MQNSILMAISVRRLVLLGCLLFVLLSIISPAIGENPFKDHALLMDMNLSGMNLSGISLNHSELQGSDLRSEPLSILLSTGSHLQRQAYRSQS